MDNTGFCILKINCKVYMCLCETSFCFEVTLYYVPWF